MPSRIIFDPPYRDLASQLGHWSRKLNRDHWLVLSDHPLKKVRAEPRITIRTKLICLGAPPTKDEIIELALEYPNFYWLSDKKDMDGQISHALETSVVEETSQAVEIRRSVRFTQHLSSAFSIPDLLSAFHQEVQKYPRVLSPMLAVSKEAGMARLFFFQGRHVRQRETLRFWHTDSRIHRVGIEESRSLANLLNRPIAKLLGFPISSSSREAIVYFEHDISETEPREFIEYISQRLHAFAIHLEIFLIEEERLAASQIWEKTFDGISDPVAIIDDEFELLRGNESFGAHERTHKKCYEIFAQLKEPCHNCPLVEKGNSTGGVLRNGKSYQVRSSRISLSAGGATNATIHHYVDMTHALNLKSQIIQTEKMAALGDLAGHIAHELNNPLTGIRSMAQVLIKSPLEAEQLREDLIEVEQATERCQKIIKNLLDYTQKDQATFTDIDVNEVIRKTLPLLKSAIGLFSNHIDLWKGPLVIRGNVSLMQQVIFNLVMNSGQSMKQAGQGELHITTNQKKNEVEIVIGDNGSGIAKGHLEKIWDPFFTTKPKGLGTGLGLSMVRRIVESLGGRIEVESEEAVGTKMILRFPLIETSGSIENSP